MAQLPKPPHSRNDFNIAIICSLASEAETVTSVFDLIYEASGIMYGKAAGDMNVYTIGVIGGHQVVLAYFPDMFRLSSRRSVEAGLRMSFPSIQVVFEVGICGVTPVHTQTKEDIVLGDCIISTGLVQYDSGRQHSQGFMKKDDMKESPGAEVRSFLSRLMTRRNKERLTGRLMHHLKILQEAMPETKYPGIQWDRLFVPSYNHQHRNGAFCSTCIGDIGICSQNCDSIGCEASQLVERQRLQSDTLPMVHFGRFGSANVTMKSGLDRDRIAREGQLIAFEMEGCAAWGTLPTIVIKSACDYADGHRSKEWQPYAAATAAAGLKALLEQWTVVDELSELETKPSTLKPIYSIPSLHQGFVGRESELRELDERLLIHKKCHECAVYGHRGIGKTELAMAFCYIVKAIYSEYSIFWISASSDQDFIRDYIKIAKKCSIHVELDKNDLIHDVKEYLSSREAGKWLLIVDDLDDLDDFTILDKLPHSEDGITLFTTRSISIAVRVAGGNLLHLEGLNPKEAMDLFKNTLQSEDLVKDEDTIKELLEKLEYLPLTIVHATGYIWTTNITISEFLYSILDSSKTGKKSSAPGAMPELNSRPEHSSDISEISAPVSASVFSNGLSQGPTITSHQSTVAKKEQIDQEDAQSIYSNDSIISESIRKGSIELLAEHLTQQILSFGIPKQEFTEGKLPELLKAFACELGHRNPDKEHLRAMLFVRKHRQMIADTISSRLGDYNGNNSVKPKFNVPEMSLADRMNNWDGSDAFEPIQEQFIIEQQDEIPEYEEENDILQPYADIVLHSSDYKRLLQKIGRDLKYQSCDHDYMNDISNTILTLEPDKGKPIRQRRPVSLQIEFVMNWSRTDFLDGVGILNARGFPNDEIVSLDTLEHALVLTGSPTDAVATTCSQYVDMIWSERGLVVLNLFKDALSDPGSIKKESAANINLSACLQDENVFVLCEGETHAVADVAEILGWLNASLYPSIHDQGLLVMVPHSTVESKPNTSNKSAGWPCGDALCCTLTMTSQRPLQSSPGTCWQAMFQNATITGGYPIPRRTSATQGLELSLPIIAVLLRTKQATCRNKSIFIREFNQALVPTCHEGNMLMWHYIYNSDGESVPYWEGHLSEIPGLKASELVHYRHFIGWCKEAESKAGLQYSP